MSSPNPYATPETLPEPDRDERFIRRYLPLLTAGLLIGCGISAVNPMFGVPVTLVVMPALLRGTRIYWRKRRAAEAVSFADWGLLVFVSLFAVIPVSVVGLLAFCCVCTPVGYVSFSFFFSSVSGMGRVGEIFMYVAVYLGLFAGLFATFFLLKRLHYLSRDEKQALEQAACPEASSEDPPAEGG